MTNRYDELWKRFLGGRLEEDPPIDEQQSLTVKRERDVSRGGNLLLILLAVVFAIVIAVSLPMLGKLRRTEFARVTEPRVLGLVTDLSKVEWASDAAMTFYVGDSVLPGSTVFRGGRIEELLDSGVRIAIDGPAEFELSNEDHAQLRHGRLYVDVPSKSLPFQVDAAGLTLHGLGAQFEVAVNGTTADLTVYKGHVSVTDPNDPALDRSLSVGAHRIQAKAIQALAIERSYDDFPLSRDAHVRETLGAVRYLKSPPTSLPQQTNSDDYILLFRETAEPIRLDHDLRVTTAGPGRLECGADTAANSIAAGSIVESFMIHFGGAASDAFQGRGRIRFAKPVLGLISGTSMLEATDEVFRSPPTYQRDGDVNLRQSWITVSDDRRTLGLDWSRDSDTKQVRVILDASSGDTTESGPAIVPDLAARFTRRYCLDCHSGQSPDGSFGIDQLDGDLSDRVSFTQWTTLYDQVQNRQMPPEESEALPEDERDEFLQAMQAALLNADGAHRQRFGRADVRRLNRVEYEHTLRDQLALPNLQVKDMLPPDGTVHGFDKSADALDFSHVQITRYLDAADHALAHALTPTPSPIVREKTRFEVKDPEKLRTNLLAFHSQLRMGVAVPMVGTEIDRTVEVDRGNFALFDYGYVKDSAPHFDGVAIMINSAGNQLFWISPFKVKHSGYYKLRVRGFGIQTRSGDLETAEQTETIAFYANSSRLLGRCDVPPNQPETREVKVWLDADDRIYVLPTSAPNKELKLPHKPPFAWHHFDSRGVCMQWFELDGPLDSEVPESHARLFQDLPLSQTWTSYPSLTSSDGRRYRVKSTEPDEDARRLLTTFAERLLRRPVCEADLRLPLQIAKTKINNGDSFVDAMLSAYRAVLCSPDFLLLQEEPGPLDGRALAARLSYFLWASPPDAELIRLADSGELLLDSVLREQVDRLLDDPKSKRFVAHFLDHWLNLRNIELTEPDSNLYPEYNALLLESMLAETQSYFAEMLREDLGVGYVVDSDFAMINQSLAKVYGIPGVKGSEIRKVSLPAGSHRGGILTQASVLKVTANGTTTSPVVRGAFVLTKILGTPPPPPPTSVSAVEPDLRGRTTIRQQLAKHREAAECASCHDLMDPPGFALESFDVMGGYRERYRVAIRNFQTGVPRVFNGKPARYKIGPVVDASGTMVDGREFAGVDQFRQVLLEDERTIARNLLSQFIVYGSGAPVSFADRELVESTLDRLEGEGFGLRSMIHEVVQSRLFREK